MQSTGIFWGNDSSTELGLPTIKPSTVGLRRRSKAPQQATSLPKLLAATSHSLALDQTSDMVVPHDSTQSLLTVLQTLWRSIAEDSNRFIGHIVDVASPVPVVNISNARYYSQGVFDEDRFYFLNERQTELQRQVTHNQVTEMRRIHCATDDNQRYCCDRRRRIQPHKCGHAEKTTERNSDDKKEMENRLIDRHDHKIRHLLHILQAEIANETKREIRALNYWSPGRPISRQSRKHFAAIVTDRYEAADRIMRILEEYHVWIGVDATKYLEATIAEGRALLKMKRS